MGKEEILIFGAGALGLGFLGPELYRDYKLTFVDRKVKKDILNWLEERHSYLVNISFPEIRTVEISGISGLNLDEEDEKERIVKKIENISLIFTAVGMTNLKDLAYLLAEGIRRRSQRENKPLFILCCENGKDVPEKLEGFLRHSLSNFPDNVTVDRTIPSRMCRYEVPISNQDSFRAVGEGIDWGVVADPAYGLPLKETLGKHSIFYGEAFQMKEECLFDALWNTKIISLNGAHAFLACLGHLKGYTYFCELAGEKYLLRLLQEMLENEVEVALLDEYSEVIDRSYLRNFVVDGIRRFLCPLFKDSIARGIRGYLHKISPEERLVTGARFILSQGHSPKIYSLLIATIIKIGRKDGKLSGSVGDVLGRHCRLTKEKDGELIKIIKENCRILEQLDNSAPGEEYQLLYELLH